MKRITLLLAAAALVGCGGGSASSTETTAESTTGAETAEAELTQVGVEEVAARTDGHVRVWPAAMYGTLRELEELDLIAESDERPSDDDERRRYFALTPLGKRVLSGEVRRLEAIVDQARASRALRKAERA